jgi:hypothetical protein
MLAGLLVLAARAMELHGLTYWPADGDNKDGKTVALSADGRRPEWQGDRQRKAWWWPSRAAATGDYLPDLLPMPATSLDLLLRRRPPLRPAAASQL